MMEIANVYPVGCRFASNLPGMTSGAASPRGAYSGKIALHICARKRGGTADVVDREVDALRDEWAVAAEDAQAHVRLAGQWPDSPLADPDLAGDY